MQPLIQPNWHIALVHFPIGLIIIGTLVELFSFLGWRGSGFRRAGRWMLLLGAILAVPATFSGLYALSELLPAGGIEELRQTNAALAKAMTLHVWTQAIATTAAMVVVVGWISFSDSWRDRLNILFKLALLGISGLILYGAHLGGDSVYNHGFGVDTARTPTTVPTVNELKNPETYAILSPPEQTHVTLAGFAAAMAAVTLGIAIRMAHTGYEPLIETAHTERIAAAFGPHGVDDSLHDTATTIVVSRNATPPIWATKFWLLSALLLIVTALAGDWILAHNGTGWNIEQMWEAIRNPVGGEDGPALTRRLAHLIAGGVLIVDTLLLAFLARFAPRSTLALLVFAVPLVLALAAQVWLGVILLFTGPAGAVTHF